MRLPLILALLLTSATLASPALAAPADTMFQATTLALSAEGQVKAAPDMATITLGVQTIAPTAAGAMRQNRERMGSVIAALKAQGIEAKDIQTSNLNLSAQYAYEQNQAPKLTGYQASNDVTVTVRALSGLGAAVDAVTAAGVNQINGVSFGLSNPLAAENDARREAVKALGAKADLYAGATGYRVARLVTLSEGGGYQPQPRPMMAMAFRAEKASTPVEPGELTVRIEVSATYELAR